MLTNHTIVETSILLSTIMMELFADMTNNERII